MSLKAIKNPPNAQVGGNHYAAACTCHPDTFAMVNNLNADTFSAIKYLTRQKNPYEDLKKAMDFIRRLRFFVYEQNIRPWHWTWGATWNIEPEEYCRSNHLNPEATAAIILICKFTTPEHLDEAEVAIRMMLSRLEPTQSDIKTKMINQLANITSVARNRLEKILEDLSAGSELPPATDKQIRATIQTIDELLLKATETLP